jgi:hypothetical protein
MPIPQPNKDESKKDFVSRCMKNDTMNKEYSDPSQRYAICNQQNKASIIEEVIKILSEKHNCGCAENDDCECEEELTLSNLIIPKPEDYIDFGEATEEYDISTLAKYKYSDPITNEIFYFDRMNTYKKNGRPLIYVGKAAEYQGRKVTLNKPFRTPDGPKKFAVYTKNNKGKVVIVRFGSKEMSIKRDDPARRKSFRARHGCDKNPGPKWKSKWWSCFQWRSNSPVKD